MLTSKPVKFKMACADQFLRVKNWILGCDYLALSELWSVFYVRKLESDDNVPISYGDVVTIESRETGEILSHTPTGYISLESKRIIEPYSLWLLVNPHDPKSTEQIKDRCEVVMYNRMWNDCAIEADTSDEWVCTSSDVGMGCVWVVCL